jgi:Domain of unknown function (DUF1918)
MTVKVGDRIVVEPEKITQSGRAGVIEEVLQERPARYRIRWDDGRTSILSPSAGVATIARQRAKAQKKPKSR